MRPHPPPSLPLEGGGVENFTLHLIPLMSRLFGVARSVKAVTIEASIDFEYFAILVTLPDNWQSLLQVTGT